MEYEDIIRELRSMKNPRNIQGMRRFGIQGKEMLGISMPVIRKMAKDIGKDHTLAGKLWKSGIHEARLLACFIDNPEQVTEKQMEDWVKDLDSWDIVDQCCGQLFDRTSFVEKKIDEWTERKEEFVKRSGFVLMAAKSVHDKQAKDKEFERYFPIMRKHATDERNFVRKAVNWALRQIGKRNPTLNKKAIMAGQEIQKIDSMAARWIANDALRELKSEAVQKRLKEKRNKK
ncbi:DNA alkylation repair protein [Candidatus Aenigmatarchaeota archaeon]